MPLFNPVTVNDVEVPIPSLIVAQPDVPLAERWITKSLSAAPPLLAGDIHDSRT